MRRRIRLLSFLGLPLIVLMACSSDEVVSPTELTPPSNLRIMDIPLSGGQVELQWDGAVSVDVTYVGYRLYAHTQSIQSLDNAQELASYEKKEVGSAVQNTVLNLGDSYTYYYVHVRAVTDEGELSRASNEIFLIARPEDEGAVVYEFATQAGNPSGYDLSEGVAVSMALTNSDRHDKTDFFLGYADGITGGGALYLWSPKRASSDYQNTTGFAGMTSSFDDLTRVPDGTTFLDHVAVTAGSVIAVKITDEHAVSNYAKLYFMRVEGDEPERTLVFQWAYQPTPGRPELVPAP